MHLDPINGIGLEAVRQFTKAGGTHLVLVGKTLRDWGIHGLGLEDFKAGFEKTIKLSKSVNSGTDATALTVLGVHPSEFLAMIDTMGPERAYEVAIDVMEHLASLYLDNAIDGIGEVGRPHFPVDEEKWALSNRLMGEFLQVAARLDCPLQLHTEHFDEGKYLELGEMVRKNGNPRKVIKHFSPPLTGSAEVAGVYPSIVSSKDSVKKAISVSNRFLMETDYIDDISRPGAVMGPKTVPKRTNQFLENGVFSEEDVATIHEELVSELYGVEF